MLFVAVDDLELDRVERTVELPLTELVELRVRILLLLSKDDADSDLVANDVLEPVEVVVSLLE
jgi:hypothetical protein